MRTSKFTPERMMHILRQGDSGVPVVALCRQHGIREQTYYRWKKRFGDLGTVEVRELPQRRACRAVGTARASVRYASVRPPQTALCRRLREIAEVRAHYGYRRMYVLSRREGWTVNHRRVYRMCRAEGLSLPRKKPKRRSAAMKRETPPAVTPANERWAMDFMSDALSDGRQLRVLTVVELYTRECVALEGAAHFRDEDVACVLTQAIAERGRPAALQCDNGTEITSRALDQWAWTTGVQLRFSRPGKPTDNATSEAFNASVRRACLSEQYFSTLAEAAIVLAA